MSTLVLNRRRSSRWSMLALAASVATALAVYSYLSYLRAQVPLAGPMAQMVVAAGDIDSGELIEAGMLRLEDHPSRYLPTGAFEDIDEAVGKLAAVPILSGDSVTERKVGKTSGASSVVPAGMRAYSLSSKAVSGLAVSPRAGDRVDLLVTYDTQQGPVTQTILRSARVVSLGVGSTGDEPLGGISSDEPGLTILVTPGHAEDVAMAEALGKIAVVLAPHEPESEPEDFVEPLPGTWPEAGVEQPAPAEPQPAEQLPAG